MLRKIVTDWHKLFSPLPFLQVSSRRGYWHSNWWLLLWADVTSSKGNGTSRPTLTPGAKQHTTTGLPRGQRAGGTASTSERFTSLPSTLLFPSLQLSSKNICLLFLGHPPHTSVLASPWPILSIVVDVMTKNKQCEGVRLPFVWAGRSPSPPLRGRISPTNTATSSFGSQILTGTWTDVK